MEQIAQEGAIQIFREVGGGMEEVVVGVVGVLQLEVLEYRLNTGTMWRSGCSSCPLNSCAGSRTPGHLSAAGSGPDQRY